jgi:Ca2+-binding EF-hand superfamily protein
MGCAASRGINPIDARLVRALREAKQRRGKHDFTFNELLLKFPKMAAGFKKCREYFNQIDLNGDKLVDMGEFTSQAGKLGLDMSLQDLRDVFEAADIDRSTKIGEHVR